MDADGWFVLDLVMLDIERESLVDTATARPDVAVDRVLFCAKETVFKAWYPLTRRQLGFHEVRVSVDADGGFTARLVIDCLPHEDARLWSMTGRWTHDVDVRGRNCRRADGDYPVAPSPRCVTPTSASKVPRRVGAQRHVSVEAP